MSRPRSRAVARGRKREEVLMLTLTRKSDYGLVALAHLARKREELSSAREIADAHRVPLPVLTNILKTLARHGLITSVRGTHGGYRLRMSPDEITLFMVVKALEGPITLFPCAQTHGRTNGCEQESWCPIIAPARRVSDRLQEFLQQVTLAEIAAPADSSEAAPVAIRV